MHEYVKKAMPCAPRCDLTSAASHYIFVEGFDEQQATDGTTVGTPSTEASKSFDSTLVQILTRKVSSIVIQTHQLEQDISTLSAFAGRNIPVLRGARAIFYFQGLEQAVLILDTSERSITMKTPLAPSEPATRLARESDAFPTLTLDDLDRITVYDNSITIEGRMALLDLAFQMLDKKWQCLISHGITDGLDASTIAFLHSALQLGASLQGSRSNQTLSLHQKIQELEKLGGKNLESQT